MKALFLALLLLASTTVLADRIDDMNAEGPEGICTNQTELYVVGIASRVVHTERAVKNITDEMRAKIFLEMEGGVHFVFPPDAIYYDDQQLNPREVKFFTEYILLGWDEGEKAINEAKSKLPKDATEVVLTKEAIHTMGEIYHDTCVQTFAPKTEVNYLNKTASSERLITPHSANSPQQEYCTDISTRAYNACMIGRQPSKP